MLDKLRPRSIYDVMAAIACVGVLAGGTAYAANTIGSADVIDDSLLTQDIKNGTLTNNDLAQDTIAGGRIKDGTVAAADLKDGGVTGAKVADGSLGSSDIADGSVGSDDIADNTVASVDVLNNSLGGSDIADNSIDSGEVVDFSLSNEDVGVLFAQINADGTVANSSGSVTAAKLGTGTYEVDFGRDIATCAYVVTQGEAGVGGAGGAITGVTDRAGNAEAVFATMRTDANALIDKAFQLVVVC